MVRVDGRELPIGGFTRRATLGFLLLNAGRVVSISELTEALWPDGHPPTARGILLNVVSALRKAGLDLVTRKPGYALRAEPDRVDLHRFRAGTARAAAAAGPEQAAALLRDALAAELGTDPGRELVALEQAGAPHDAPAARRSQRAPVDRLRRRLRRPTPNARTREKRCAPTQSRR